MVTCATSNISAAERRSERRGWLVVAGAFAVMFVSFGVVYSFSAFFASLQEAFAAPRGAVSLIFSITAALYCTAGIVSGPLADRFGPRPIALFGALMSGAGLFVAASAEALWQIYVGFGFGLGLGVGFAYVSAVASVQRWFSRNCSPPLCWMSDVQGSLNIADRGFCGSAQRQCVDLRVGP